MGLGLRCGSLLVLEVRLVFVMRLGVRIVSAFMDIELEPELGPSLHQVRVRFRCRCRFRFRVRVRLG